MSKQLESVEHFSDSGKVKAKCGHMIDVRLIVYVHTDTGVTTSCAKCAEKLERYVPSDL